MTTDYAQISKENTRRYGTDIDVYGSTLLANLYSDRTHFLYELIQNAEDASATHIEFRLFSDRLEIRHNGRAFTREDVRSICGLVDSTKKDDLTQIGKFGIGFKSVYAYTDAPHVYSRDEAFCIRNYVHPEAVEPVALSEEETLFLLPFDHNAVAPHMAFAEIASRLQNLGLRTLLFLRHISEIRWIIEGADDGNYICNSKAIGAQARFVHILSRVQDQEQQEEWIVFTRPVGGSVERDLRVEIAYQMDIAAEAAENRLIQTRDATLVAFFETDKETRLWFLMQGPYRTTPARDNIPGYDSWNKELIQETAILVSDSIVEMKRMGLLKVDFLSILPIFESDFPAGSMFRPIYNAVRKRLKGTEALLPTADGDYTNARHAYLARGRDLIDLLDPDHLRRLFGRRGKWLDVGITADRTPALRSYLISELGIAEVDPERFARQVDQKFMAAQDDIWVARFYKYLLNHTALLRKPQTRSGSWGRRIATQEGGTLSQAPIIRLSVYWTPKTGHIFDGFN
jgi:hypothetical protein